jgi:hypothetical protein
MHARGSPTVATFYTDLKTALDHRRLVIIDLSTVARQPLSNVDGTVGLSDNSEVYNGDELRTEPVARGYHSAKPCSPAARWRKAWVETPCAAFCTSVRGLVALKVVQQGYDKRFRSL